MTTKTPEALAVLDTMARGCALWADFCVGPRKAEWMAELAKYDKARAAFAAEHEALKSALALLERNAVKIDAEWGMVRDLEEIDGDGDLDPQITTARAALAAVEVLK